MRLDKFLVENKKVSSRTKAQELISSGAVLVNGQAVTEASYQLRLDQGPQVTVQCSPLTKYVSRAGLKLEGALERLGLKVHGYNVLDVGVSTGGFTDCLLKAGALHLVGVDVGHGQLAAPLIDDLRVTLFEGLNARHLESDPRWPQNYRNKFDLIVCDVSFISLTLVLPAILGSLKTEGHLLSLVKPQFEVQKKDLDKKGVIKDPSIYDSVEKTICDLAKELSLEQIQYFPSQLPGKDGNQEFFIYGKK